MATSSKTIRTQYGFLKVKVLPNGYATATLYPPKGLRKPLARPLTPEWVTAVMEDDYALEPRPLKGRPNPAAYPVTATAIARSLYLSIQR